MTNRDFVADDGIVLAEFAGLDYEIYLYREGVFEPHIECWIPEKYRDYDEKNDKDIFKPWLHQMNQWQIQSLLDAVREKGLMKIFTDRLLDYLQEEDSILDYDSNLYFEVASAPPEAICRSILQLEGE